MRRAAIERDPASAPAGPGLHVQVCRDAACRQVGADALLAAAAGHRHCRAETAPCLGLCTQAPALLLHGAPHAGMSPARLDELLADVGVA